MKKILLGASIGVAATILGFLVFIGVVANDNFFTKKGTVSDYWYW